MIKLDNVSKKFGTGTALTDVTFSVDKGEFIFLVGPSGSGKTTLFRLLTKEMTPTSGTIHIGEWNIGNLAKKHIPHLRKSIGVIFQDLKLLKDRTILENILLPLEVANADESNSKKKIDEILEQVGILEHKHKFPIQLSGGELQRAAIARALAFSPEIILADEPTGNLDSTTSWEIVKLLQDINKTGTTIIMATHNTEIVNSLMKRVVVLEKGRLVDDQKSKAPIEETQS
ncbi:MAG TPA: ATP-binding cassette domain-containing protein [Candidatus Limnocylindrales bacterium]|nr:ATP-binding cassette domain-containing protein [Candidatus Limnocylindrales bacterium]